MKKALVIIGGSLLSIALIVTILLAYLGIFSTLKPVERTMGPYTFVYEDFIGPYMDTAHVFDNVYKNLEKEGLKTTRGLGIYYDDPSKIPDHKLRSKCGSIIEKEDLSAFNKIKDKFKVITIEDNKSIVIEFPIKNTLSYMMGPMKCYPALAEYVKEKGLTMKGNAYELYDMPAKKILFILPIAD